jgi:hypothetical protein
MDQSLIEQATDAENISSIITLKIIHGVNKDHE